MLIDEIKKFVRYQNVLCGAFFLEYPGLKDFRCHLDFPRKGYLKVNNEDWSFRRHGLGILFERYNKVPNIKIDVTNFIDNPNIFDTWRLSIYLNSIGYYAYDSILENEIKRIELNHIIKKFFDNGHYYVIINKDTED